MRELLGAGAIFFLFTAGNPLLRGACRPAIVMFQDWAATVSQAGNFF